MLPTLLGYLLAHAILFGPPHYMQARPMPKTKSATVRFTVVDGLGSKLADARVESFTNQKGGPELAKEFHVDRFRDLKASGVPYGDYILRVLAAGFPELERPVHISDPDVRLDVCVRTASVHIVLDYDLAGTSAEFKVESFKSRDDGADLVSRFQHGTGTKIPYGPYDLAVFAHLGTGSRRVDVFQPETWVIVGPETYGETEVLAPRKPFTGTVENISPEDEPVFVRLMGIYFNYSLDDRVAVKGTSGTFTLVGFEPYGRYLLLTIGKKGILDIRPFDITQTSPIVIKLHGETTTPTEQH